MKKLKVLVVVSLLIGISYLNASEKINDSKNRDFKSPTMLAFENIISNQATNENINKIKSTCNKSSNSFYLPDNCKDSLIDNLKTKQNLDKNCAFNDRSIKIKVLDENIKTLAPNEADEKEMVKFFEKSADDYLTILYCK